MKPGLLPFGFVSAQSQGFQTCSFAKASPKGKIPDSEWLQFFLNRSKRRLELSERAKRDFRDILSYTLTNWGESQMANYGAGIDDALHIILRNPSVGRPSVKPTLKVLPVGHHRIFYRTINDTIYIVRILHERMDASRHLK